MTEAVTIDALVRRKARQALIDRMDEAARHLLLEIANSSADPYARASAECTVRTTVRQVIDTLSDGEADRAVRLVAHCMWSGLPPGGGS